MTGDTADLAIAKIKTGQWDEHLDEIVAAIKHRRLRKANDTFLDLEVGDTVRIVRSSKKYLNGATAEVTQKRISKVTILFPDEMDRDHDPYGKFAGRKWIFPPAALEKAS